MLIRVVLSARKRGERNCLLARCCSCSVYLIRHSIRRISVFRSPIASSIKCKLGHFFLAQPGIRYDLRRCKPKEKYRSKTLISCSLIPKLATCIANSSIASANSKTETLRCEHSDNSRKNLCSNKFFISEY